VLGRLGLKEREYFVVSAHREENIDFPDQFARLCDVLNRLAETARAAGDRLDASADPQNKSDQPRASRCIRWCGC